MTRAYPRFFKSTGTTTFTTVLPSQTFIDIPLCQLVIEVKRFRAPVLLSLGARQLGGNLESSVSLVSSAPSVCPNVVIAFLRNAVSIGEYAFGKDALTTNEILELPSSMYSIIDIPVLGTNIYKVQIRSNNALCTAKVDNVGLDLIQYY